VRTPRLAIVAGTLVILVVAQIYLGALVAGLRAGLIYNTWPLIDGSIVPPAKDMFFDAPLWRNFFENALTVQFDHRMLAYGVSILAVAHVFDVLRSDGNGPLVAGAGLLAVATLAQMAIGIITLMNSAPVGLALMHQAMALVVLTAATLNAARTIPRLQRRQS
jgi:cytochrome c oxidase assembly protein subunit 15